MDSGVCVCARARMCACACMRVCLCVRACADPGASHCHIHCLLLHPSFDGCSRICSCEPQKSVNVNFPADGSVLIFFLTGDVRCLQSITWCFLSGSWWICVSFHMTVHVRNASTLWQ